MAGTNKLSCFKKSSNLALGKNNQVLLTIGQILGTIADNTGWLIGVFSVFTHVCRNSIKS